MKKSLTKILTSAMLIGLVNTTAFAKENKIPKQSLMETIKMLKTNCENTGECILPSTYSNNDSSILRIKLGYEQKGVFKKNPKNLLVLPPKYLDKP